MTMLRRLTGTLPSEEPPDAHQVADPREEAVRYAIFSASTETWTMVDDHLGVPASLGRHQLGEKALHAMEKGEREEAGTPDDLS
jgi:hypothetical protein